MEYNFGKQTDESVEIILKDLGIDMEHLQCLSNKDKYTFSKSILTRIKKRFPQLCYWNDSDKIQHAILHALKVN
jgi:hypothetical protein